MQIDEHNKSLGEEQKHESDRRKLLKWATPVITSVVLPAHGQTSVVPETPKITLCSLSPVATALGPSKCTGFPGMLIGEASIEITASDSVIKITSITHNAPPGNSITLPSLPDTVTPINGITIFWIGPGSDPVTCLPDNPSSIVFDISYTCDGSATATWSFDLTEVLLTAII